MGIIVPLAFSAARDPDNRPWKMLQDRPARQAQERKLMMRRLLLAWSASALFTAFAGCACTNCGNSNCPGNACPGRATACQQGGQQPGPGGMVSYPYYTNRGPRDFLETHPQSIGP
jgi:hypothetical protein